MLILFQLSVHYCLQLGNRKSVIALYHAQMLMNHLQSLNVTPLTQMLLNHSQIIYINILDLKGHKYLG